LLACFTYRIVPFQLIVSAKGLNGTKARTKLPLYFKDSSLKWYISLGDYHALKDVFLRRFEHLIEEQSGTKQSYVEVYIVKTTTFFSGIKLVLILLAIIYFVLYIL
jgi:hypothetical protein